jgi:hypothetical protein
MRKYKVLWFDDEHEGFQPIKDEALIADVQLIGYSNAQEGIPELMKNHKDYDAVILDGLFFKNEEQSGTDIDQSAFGEVAKVLSDLKAQNKILPWFIYSGQKSFVKDKNVLVDVLKDESFANGKVFDKNKDEDFTELLNEIKKAADVNHIRIVKANYPDAFTPFDIGLINKNHEHLLIDIINSYQKQDYRKKNITVQRDLLEAIFKSLNNPIPCLHESFFDPRKNNKPNLEWCTRFIEGRDTNGHKLNKEVPLKIKAAFRIVVETTNEYSHLSDEIELKTPFIANTFLLLGILEWLPNFAKKHYANYI